MSHSLNDEEDEDRNLNKTFTDLSRMIRQGRSFSGHERNCCFLNTGKFEQPGEKGCFATISALSGLDFPDDARAVVALDWDGDGDLDLWLANRNAPRLRFLRNNLAPDNNYITFKLFGNGSTCNRDAIGARIEIFTTEQTDLKQIKTVSAGAGFISQTSRWISFGLGQAKKVERVLISWPDGSNQELTTTKINNSYLVVQGEQTAKIWRRPQTDSKLIAKLSPTTPTPTTGDNQSIRIPLVTPLPLPEINYFDNNHEAQKQLSGHGRKILINLFSRQSRQSAAELRTLQQGAQELEQAGINLLALEIDDLTNSRPKTDINEVFPESFTFPFRYGFASPTLIADLKRIHNLSVPLERPLPIPTSFLIDTQGRVSMIYKGSINPQQLARDASRETNNFTERVLEAMPFKGTFCYDPQLLRPLRENFALKMLHGGRRLEKMGRLNEALSYYYEVLKVLPDAAIPRYRLGETHYQLRNLNATISNLKQALEKDPDLTPARQLLARIHLAQGQAQPAALQLLTILQKNPQDSETLANLGIAYAALGRPDMACSKLEKALKIAPENASTNFNLGVLNLRGGHLKKAEKAFTKTILLQADYPGVRYHLGVLAEQQQKPENAVRFYRQELKNNPRHLKATLRLGELYEKKGKVQEATTMYKTALDIDPDQPLAKASLKRLQGR